MTSSCQLIPAGPHGWSRIATLLIAAAVAALAGCGSGSSNDPGVVNNSPSSRPGNQAVYVRIETSTNCVALQREFDIAADNTDRLQDAGQDADVPMSYMDAANNRMREMGCYG